MPLRVGRAVGSPTSCPTKAGDEAEIDDGVYVENLADKCAKDGVVAGCKIETQKRMQIEYVHGRRRSKYTKVIAKGSSGTVKSLGDDKVEVEFELEHEGQPKLATAMVLLSNVSVVKQATASSSSGGAACPPGHEYAGPHGGKTVTLDPWPPANPDSDTSLQMAGTKGYIAYLMKRFTEQMPVYTKSDLAILLRDGTAEVWTQRAFPPWTLLFVPQTTEIKDTHWTLNRSSKVKHDVLAHPEQKAFGLDGRLRTKTVVGGNGEEPRHPSLFFCTTRTPSESDANMKVLWSAHSSTFQLDFNLPAGAKKRSIEDKCDNIQIPIMGNPKKILQHTRLTVLEDAELKQLAKKQVIDNMKQIGKAALEAGPKKKAKSS